MPKNAADRPNIRSPNHVPIGGPNIIPTTNTSHLRSNFHMNEPVQLAERQPLRIQNGIMTPATPVGQTVQTTSPAQRMMTDRLARVQSRYQTFKLPPPVPYVPTQTSPAVAGYGAPDMANAGAGFPAGFVPVPPPTTTGR